MKLNEVIHYVYMNINNIYFNALLARRFVNIYILT